MIKKIFIALLNLVLLNAATAQHKQRWNSLFLYSFKLAPEVPAQYLEAVVLYKGRPMLPPAKGAGGKRQLPGMRFTYSLQPTDNTGSVTLPFVIPGGSFTLLMDAEMLLEMTQYPDRYKFRVNKVNKDPVAGYVLPEVFDFIPGHALNIAYLHTLSPQERDDEINENAWMLSLASLQVTPLRDTTLTYSLTAIPKGILLALPGISKAADTVQRLVIDKAFLFKHRLLMPVPAKKQEPPKPFPDRCFGILTDMEGRTCATSGCISGMGSGDCALLKNAAGTLSYRISVLITP
ncbi:hypothetical protein [Ferruginibacter sp. HRS2-29]|uniref:hypothetical protein n=1 Tax=Ferruginibacter sp. HRS2-29 TaxID=2487334 RepID=UPI0020CFCB8F|nr:hypothetical protein [Ferruginibacter sp. HRS2-29]MCP9753519.1 hypothetical protein [Ferruginibacter sp. HRS2-29]